MDELVGKKFGEWTVLSFSRNDKYYNKYYFCQCTCGTSKEITRATLIHNRSRRCMKCYSTQRSMKLDDLTGQKIGKWTIQTSISLKGVLHYICTCDCGTIKYVRYSHLTSGLSKQCSKCRKRVTHGMSYTETYNIWHSMIIRCTNAKHKSYARYGGRGIIICDRWFKFENFLEDMGERPHKLQLDRIDNDGNYEPGNCRWVTSRENNLNRPSAQKNKANLSIF